MSLSLDELALGLFFLVPGFIASRIEAVLRPNRFESATDEVSASLLRSLLLNALAGVAALGWLSAIGALPISQIGPALARLPVADWASYLALLYGLAAVWGFCAGLVPGFGLRGLARRLGFTSVGDTDSVWNTIFVRHVERGRQSTWLRIADGDDNAPIFGRLRHSSALVSRELPIEVYLSPVYAVAPGGLEPVSVVAEAAGGLYLKLTPDHRTFFLVRPESWNPVVVSAPSTIPTEPSAANARRTP